MGAGISIADLYIGKEGFFFVTNRIWKRHLHAKFRSSFFMNFGIGFSRNYRFLKNNILCFCVPIDSWLVESC